MRHAAAAAIGLGFVVVALSNGCTSAIQSAGSATQGCNGLDLTSEAQLSVSEWVTALNDLDTAAAKVEADWLQVCNDINAELMIPAKTTASDACGALKAYIASKGTSVTIALTVQPPVCQADVSLEANCEAKCAAAASCDVKASCQPGQLVVECMGTCNAECDITAPTVSCSGMCKGECSASAAVMCAGECNGSCDANCTGSCNGTPSMGTQCMGTCVGTCSGMCTGKCTVSAGAQCTGMCNGTCVVTDPMATCTGECHGSCTGTASPPTCTGQLNCMATAKCTAACHAQADASLNCSPAQAQVVITGDMGLLAAFEKHLDELGQAFQLTQALTMPIADVAGQTATTLSTVGDIGLAGATCVASQAQVVTHVQASISVSVSASVTVSGA
jgi:hypothetical protein